MMQQIKSGDVTLAYIIKKKDILEGRSKYNFITPMESNQQVGVIRMSIGTRIENHYHNPLKREIIGTTETLVVMSGSCIVDIYDNQQSHVVSELLSEGDVISILAGGHGFRMTNDIILLEVKQGPYIIGGEKTRF